MFKEEKVLEVLKHLPYKTSLLLSLFILRHTSKA